MALCTRNVDLEPVGFTLVYLEESIVIYTPLTRFQIVMAHDGGGSPHDLVVQTWIMYSIAMVLFLLRL